MALILARLAARPRMDAASSPRLEISANSTEPISISAFSSTAARCTRVLLVGAMKTLKATKGQKCSVHFQSLVAIEMAEHPVPRG